MMSGTAHGDAAALERMQLEPKEMQTPPPAATPPAAAGRGRGRSAMPPGGRSFSRPARSEASRLYNIQQMRRRRASSAGDRDRERQRERSVERRAELALDRADVLVGGAGGEQPAAGQAQDGAACVGVGGLGGDRGDAGSHGEAS